MLIDERRGIARRMLATGKFTLDEIMDIVELPIAEIQKLQNEKTA